LELDRTFAGLSEGRSAFPAPESRQGSVGSGEAGEAWAGGDWGDGIPLA